MQPFTVVEGAGFRCMIKTLEPQYKIPSRISVSNNNYLFLAFVKDNFLCQINEKHVGTSNVSSLAVPESYLLLT